MKLGKYDITLAKQSAPNTSGEEQGSSGAQPATYFTNENALVLVKNPSIRQIMNMLDEDGTAAGLYSVMSFPVLATDWHMKPDPEDVIKNKDGTESHPQADFVEEALRAPLHKGGMSTPFSLVLADILLGLAQGYRFFELVYKLNDKGQVVFQKIASRDPWDITIETDDTGGFAGVKQNVKRNGSSITVNIELPYCFLYTYRKDRNKLKGLSAFRAAFYHYDKKHRLYYLANQQAQVAAVNLKTLESPEGAEKKDRDANLAAVDKMAVRPSIALPFGYKLTVTQPGRTMELLPYIDHHNVEMARSVLAQMMMLGTQSDSKGGSFALSESQNDLFMLGERTLMNTIEEHITSFLISKLIDFNFDKPLYPQFEFNDLSDTVTTMLNQAFNALITKGSVPQWLTDGISKKVAEHMEIEEPEEGDLPAADTDVTNEDGSITHADGSVTPAPPAPVVVVPAAEDTTVKNSTKKKETKLAKGEWWRELTAPEAKVKFSAIKKKADTEEEQMLKDLKPVFFNVASDATKRLKPLLEDKGVKALDGFDLKFGSDMQKVFANHMLNMYSDAKTGAADEIKKPAPGNKQTSKDLIGQHAQGIVDKQQSDLLFNIKTIVTDAIRKNLLDKTEFSVGTVIATISDMFDTFFNDKEDLTVSSLISFALNLGRDDVFQQYQDDTYGYQYSAILDDAVCPICEDLDGSVVKPEVYYSTIWMPPIHFNCRCIWVAIMNDEDDKPDFQDIPESPGGASGPSLSHQHEADEYALYLSKEAEASWLQRRH